MTVDSFVADDVRLLGEIGYAAANRGLHREAERIFAAMEALRPASAAAGIGRALMAVSRGRYDEAVQVIERQALKAEPDSIEAREVLAMALQLAGRASERDRALATIGRLRSEREERPDESSRT